MPTDPITNRDLYEEMQSMRRDFTTEIGGLRTTVVNLQLSEAKLSTKFYMVLAGLVVVGSAIVSLLINKVGDKFVSFFASIR